jgi:cation diffusion facilitator family transporter
MKTPQQALAISVGAAAAVVSLKWGAWWLTGSVAFLSDAVHSLVNLAAASFALLMVVFARRAPTASHPYGYGKAEYFSAAFEGALITVAAVGIFVAVTERILSPQALEPVATASGLSALAALINLTVARLLVRAGRAHHSLATEADGRHLLSDVWITVGVLVGVALTALSGWARLDPIVAALVALNLLRTGLLLLARSVSGLLDAAWPNDDIEALQRVLRRLEDEGAAFRNLRTRVSGAQRFASVELTVPPTCAVARANDIARAAEQGASRLGATLLVRIVPVSP